MLGETVAVVAALVWLYVAIIGTVRPNDLPLHIISWVPLRRDTVGIGCFGLSAAACLVSGLLRGRSVSRVVLGTVFGYSTVIAIYLMVGTVTHPETLTMALTHLANWPTERMTLVLAFATSICSFVLLRTSTHTSRTGIR
ncbi:hypothetical protein MMAD_10420 [Mycolicibacterium madagascariense]|uniref:Uncharacterized protein n=1 Tax=Mycolicibacterium madagascariense TaxID=212765 RepID=A0A7I7XCY3_9MYCO|nr:hypothetical protein MMAD_10420 [Mycolicibacterium madagascariense]